MKLHPHFHATSIENVSSQKSHSTKGPKQHCDSPGGFLVYLGTILSGILVGSILLGFGPMKSTSVEYSLESAQTPLDGRSAPPKTATAIKQQLGIPPEFWPGMGEEVHWLLIGPLTPVSSSFPPTLIAILHAVLLQPSSTLSGWVAYNTVLMDPQ